MAPDSSTGGLAWVQLLKELTCEWQDQELTDVSILVARLFFRRETLSQPMVCLSDLMGTHVGDHDIYVCVPESHFSICEMSRHDEPGSPAQLQQAVREIDNHWAFHGTGNFGVDGWLLLQCSSGRASESGRVVLLVIRRHPRSAEAFMQSASGALALGAGSCRELHIPDVDNVTVYV